jgi:5-methylthioribose kinase
VQVTTDTTYAIDAEFAFYGPMGFDVGKLMANFAMSLLALDGLAMPDKPRAAQRAWLRSTLIELWEVIGPKDEPKDCFRNTAFLALGYKTLWPLEPIMRFVHIQLA